jgi:hypothetical protein
VLLHNLHHGRRSADLGLAQEKMDVLGHDDVSDDYEAIAFAGLFEDGEEAISAAGGTKKQELEGMARAS